MEWSKRYVRKRTRTRNDDDDDDGEPGHARWPIRACMCVCGDILGTTAHTSRTCSLCALVARRLRLRSRMSFLMSLSHPDDFAPLSRHRRYSHRHTHRHTDACRQIDTHWQQAENANRTARQPTKQPASQPRPQQSMGREALLNFSSASCGREEVFNARHTSNSTSSTTTAFKRVFGAAPRLQCALFFVCMRSIYICVMLLCPFYARFRILA